MTNTSYKLTNNDIDLHDRFSKILNRFLHFLPILSKCSN